MLLTSNNRVLLITPPYHAGVLESAGRWPHLGFVYIAGHLRGAGFEPVIYDAMTKMHDLETIKRRIAAERPAVVATTAYTSSAPAAIELLRTVKSVDPRIITLIGGVHAHFMYEEVLKENPDAVDFVVRGEGEITFPELLLAIRQGVGPDQLSGLAGIAYLHGSEVIATPARPFVHDLDTLMPAWDLVEWSDYTFYPLPKSRMAIIDTSRGCNHDCSFCSQQRFWERSFRGRRPERVVEEMVHLHDTYGVNVFMFSDEYPTKDRERWERFLDLIIDSGLESVLLMETRVEDIVRDKDILPKYKRAGVLHIYVGVEATNQVTLDRFKKELKCQESLEAINLIRDNGMISECSFVLGLPEDTPETIEETLRLAKYYDPDFPHFLHIAPWPYAELYEELAPYIITRDYSKYNFIEPVVKPAAMSEAEIAKALIDCYRNFYMDKVQQYAEIEDDFRREYLLRSMRVMMENSFLKQHMGGGKIPEQVRRFLCQGKSTKVKAG